MQPVHVIDYGIGNIFNILRALQHIGLEVIHCQRPEQIPDNATRLILPGVGAFGHCMQALQNQGFVNPIMRHVNNKKLLLGVCVGMQMLADTSDEFGQHRGLGLIPGKVQSIKHLKSSNQSLKLPHIGWRRLISTNKNPYLLAGWYYFVHSYAFICDDSQHAIAYCEYEDRKITSVVARDNIIGLQFHPEKSAEMGLALLRRLLL